MSACRSCGEPIRWAKTSAGKNIPVDIEPTSEGNIVFEDGVAVVLPALQAKTYDGEKFISHFVTCEDADKWRRK